MVNPVHDTAVGSRPLALQIFALGLLLLAPAAACAVLPVAPDCALRATLGWPCPGCGLGRALSALFRLELAGAVSHYPPFPLLLLGYGLLVVWVAAPLVGVGRTNRRGTLIPLGRGLGLCGVVACIAVLTHWTTLLITWRQT